MKKSLLVSLFLLTVHCSLLTVFAQGTPGTVRYPTNADTLDSLFGRLTDNPQTTLNGSISSGATTITTVASGTAAFGSSGSLKIDNETIYYTAKTSNTFTGVIRGRDGTTATSHTSGAKITSPILTVHHRTLVNALIATQEKVDDVGDTVDGLGTIATQDANNVAISGGSLSGVSFSSGFSVSGTVNATAFTGNGSGLTGISAACSSGSCSGTSSPGALSLIADNNSSGSDGIIDLINSGGTRARVNNDGSMNIYETLRVGTSGRASASRIELATETSTIVSTWVRTHTWDNGPPGQETYKQHSYSIASYNENDDSSKIIPGVASWNFAAEMPFFQEGPDGEFITEWHLNYQSPDGSVSKRFFGMGIGETTGDPATFLWGKISLRDTDGNPTLEYTPADGRLDFTFKEGSQILLPNNSPLFYKNAAHDNTIPVISLNDDDEVEVAPGGQLVRVSGSLAVAADVDASQFRIAGDTDTYIRSIFSGFMDFQSNGSRNFSIQPTAVNVVGVPLVCETDGTCDLGKVSGADHRFNNAYFKLNVELSSSGVYKVGSNQVVGARQAGWGAPTGTATRTTFATTTVTTEELAQRLKALIDDLTTHGLVGP